MSPRLARASALLLKARALEWSPDAVVIGRLDGRILMLNAAASRMLGCTARSAARLGFPWLRDRDLRARSRLAARAGIRGAEVVHRTVEARRADGTRFRASIALTVLGRGRRAAVAAHIRDLSIGGLRDRPQGGDVLLYAASGFPGPETLMARIGHDLNNPLAIVVAQATVLHDLAPDPDVARRAERIMAAAHRAGRIVESLTATVPRRPPEPSVGEPGAAALDAPVPAPGGADVGTRPRTVLTVLVVDDEPDVAEALADVVGLLGHRALVAVSAGAALDAVRRRRFDAAILDLHMPDVDGMALRRVLVALDPGLAGRTAIVTGDGTGRIAEGLAGPFPTLKKPFTLDDVRALLLRLASR